MHVAFGRVRRKSRIVADYTDDADFRIWVYRRFLVRRAGAVYYGLGTQTGKFAVQASSVSGQPSAVSRQQASGIGVLSYKKWVI